MACSSIGTVGFQRVAGTHCPKKFPLGGREFRIVDSQVLGAGAWAARDEPIHLMPGFEWWDHGAPRLPLPRKTAGQSLPGCPECPLVTLVTNTGYEEYIVREHDVQLLYGIILKIYFIATGQVENSSIYEYHRFFRKQSTRQHFGTISRIRGQRGRWAGDDFHLTSGRRRDSLIGFRGYGAPTGGAFRSHLAPLSYPYFQQSIARHDAPGRRPHPETMSVYLCEKLAHHSIPSHLLMWRGLGMQLRLCSTAGFPVLAKESHQNSSR
ncbi:hypothetical protein QBC35DRAFT_474824 [Podospora australis]|uniref:Uncharacterized protein n=1 Tax=Podospora australis TaxID=1536484 RepID=A0AAN6WRZ4_9PEZI|nr:hypothetical protein QBC35DRAFT_474824 [Podospora australis]